MAVEIAYRVVDVFSDRPLAGNALCVVVDPCPDALQQPVAREVNLSETTFPVVTGDGTYEMRIFTPHTELPFAGHPSLGTAWVLGPGRWTQTTAGATVVVEADAAGAVMTQPDPVFATADPAAAAAAVGLAGAEEAAVAEAAGLRHLVVATEAPIQRLDPDPARVAAATRAVRASTLCVVRRLDDRTLHVRVFAPAEGIAEDPGTGAAAGPVAVFARSRWGTDPDVVVLQGAEVGRPSRIDVHAEPGNLRVGGNVAPCASGHLTL